MLPSLSYGRFDAGEAPLRVLPPQGFRPAPKRIIEAGFLNLTQINPGSSHAQRRGLRYEQQVLDALEAAFGDGFMPNPWLWFRGSGGCRRCQPDGIVFLPDRIAIVEVKLSHTPYAWWQLSKLYAPVVRRMFNRRPIGLVEITTAYDPMIRLPEPVTLLHSFEEIATKSFETPMKVLSWKP
jgi:hypothetical protein